MSDNNIDVTVLSMPNGRKKVCVSYYHFSRKEEKRMTSETRFVWEGMSPEIANYFSARRTKVFYSQIRAMARFYGKKERVLFNAKK